MEPLLEIPTFHLPHRLAAGGSVIGLSAQADLIGESHANLSMRNLYFNSGNRDGTAQPSRTEEWAQGFLLDLRSRYTDGVVGFGVGATAMLGPTELTGMALSGGTQESRK